jgi:hypothetical protein
VKVTLSPASTVWLAGTEVTAGAWVALLGTIRRIVKPWLSAR